MSKIRRITIKKQLRRGAADLSSAISEASREEVKPRIVVYSYGDKTCEVTRIGDYDEIGALLKKHKTLTHWIEVQGLGDDKLFGYLGKLFNIHELVLEDITSHFQRPKLDEYDSYLFAASRLIYINENLEIENEQLSFLLLDNVLISFQQNHTTCLDTAVTMLKGAKGLIRSGGSSYMLYVLIDIVIDKYFELIYKMGDELDIIEELLYRRPDKGIMYKIQEVRRAMILIRRAAWPQRDMINDMIRSESTLISKDSRTFLKDVYDHTMQVVDLVESYKDVTTTLIDTNLAIVSNRMNEIMKVLTVISSIFIPLTFIAGVYGMNFAREDPETHRFLPLNMPELYAPNGYLITMIVMLLIAVVQVIFFARKGWFK